MSEDQQRPETVQLNLADGQRNAGRDYYERYENRVPDSIKLYLATTSSDRLDEEAIDNERLFAYRFGFDAPRVVREQIVAIKQRYGFTDRELRWLRRSGQLRIRHTEAKLASDPWVMRSGWIQMAIFTFVCVISILQVAFSIEPSWKQALGMTALLAVWFAVAWGINSLYIAPWRLLRRVGVE